MEELAIPSLDASTEYVGRWNRLVSTTNWEKGRIIAEWREALRASGAEAGEYSDEAWSRAVGNVTPQHVGRLRRVHERFGDVYEQYAGLYWSHFHAALDWPDAEMYLEGAVQCGWSVSQMRNQRWENLGRLPDHKPDDADIVAAEWDEDISAADDAPPSTISESTGEVHDAGYRPDALDDESESAESDAEELSLADSPDLPIDAPEAALVRPFEALPPLPADLNEAFDLFRLAILNHKVSGWREIARSDVLTVLESLKQLALAPAE